ncbi:MAG: GNAT family N-acetyltransferase [bacterium]|nr:GNAT family N-acetyltransferase [bacterium]
MKPTFKQVTKTRYVEQIAQLAEEIFVQHYTKLTPKVARALAQTYQSDLLTDEQIHSGAINYFLVYLGSEPVGYFALDLSPAGAVCLSRLFLLEKARGQGIGRSVAAYAQKLAEGDGRSRLYLKVWAKDLKAEEFCKKCRFRKSEVVPTEVLPGVTLDLATWEKLWR